MHKESSARRAPAAPGDTLGLFALLLLLSAGTAAEAAPADEPQLYTAEQVSALTGISVQKLKRWRLDKPVLLPPSERRGRIPLYSEEAIEKARALEAIPRWERSKRRRFGKATTNLADLKRLTGRDYAFLRHVAKQHRIGRKRRAQWSFTRAQTERMIRYASFIPLDDARRRFDIPSKALTAVIKEGRISAHHLIKLPKSRYLINPDAGDVARYAYHQRLDELKANAALAARDSHELLTLGELIGRRAPGRGRLTKLADDYEIGTLDSQRTRRFTRDELNTLRTLDSYLTTGQIAKRAGVRPEVAREFVEREYADQMSRPKHGRRTTRLPPASARAAIDRLRLRNRRRARSRPAPAYTLGRAR